MNSKFSTAGSMLAVANVYVPNINLLPSLALTDYKGNEDSMAVFHKAATEPKDTALALCHMPRTLRIRYSTIIQFMELLHGSVKVFRDLFSVVVLYFPSYTFKLDLHVRVLSRLF